MPRYIVTRHFGRDSFDYFHDLDDSHAPSFAGSHRAAWTFHTESFARDMAGSLNSYHRHAGAPAGTTYTYRAAELAAGPGPGMMLIGTPYRIRWTDGHHRARFAKEAA